MTTINDLSKIEKAHWELHLNGVKKDTPALTKEVLSLLRGGELPDIKHPAHIHDWLEQLDRRTEIEAQNG